MKRCINCMEEKPEGQSICPYCGYDEEITEERIDQLKPGSLLNDRFVVGRPLGRGGFGITYIAWDNSLQRKVAIKEYLPKGMAMRNTENTTVTCDEDSREAFLRGVEKTIEESRKLARLSHLGSVVNVYDCFKANGTAYIVMELLSGQNVKEKLNKDGAFSFEDTLKIIKPVLETLATVHKEGIIHRDISPDNIFICDNGKIKVLDFGSAKATQGNEEKSRTIILKRGYAPKEQYIAKSIQGPYTDIYSVSATIYKMLTGVTPPDGLDRALEPEEDRLKDIAELVQLPAPAAAAIMKGMAINPQDRIQSAEELLEELQKEDKKPDYDDAERTVTLYVDPIVEPRIAKAVKRGGLDEPVPANSIAAVNPPEPSTVQLDGGTGMKQNKKKKPVPIPVEAEKSNTGKKLLVVLLILALVAAGVLALLGYFNSGKIYIEPDIYDVEVSPGGEARVNLKLVDKTGTEHLFRLPVNSDDKTIATGNLKTDEDGGYYITVKGVSEGSTKITFELCDSKTGEVYDTKTLNVTVKDGAELTGENGSETAGASLSVGEHSVKIDLGDNLYVRYSAENDEGCEVRVSSDDTGVATASVVNDDDGDWVFIECYGKAGKTKVHVDLMNTESGETLVSETITVSAEKPDKFNLLSGELEYSGETYRVTTKNKNSPLIYRKAPVITEKDSEENNIAGRIAHGEEIKVDYIYDGTWAVFRMDGEYVFASIYAGNDPSQYRLLTVV